MKIEACWGGVDVGQRTLVRKETENGRESFSACLTEYMERAETGPPLFNGPIQGTTQGSGVAGVSWEVDRPTRGVLCEMGVQTLDSLERYQRRLADLTVPLDGLTGLLDEVRERGESLRNHLDWDAIEDGLQALLSEIASLAFSEVERFTSGEYAE